MTAEANMSTVLGGRRLLVELDRRRRVDAYNCQFTGCRATRIHVEIDVIPPGVRCAAGPPAMLDTARLDRAGCPAERWRKWGAGGGRRSCPGHDGCRERTRTWLRSPGLRLSGLKIEPT